MLTRDLAAALAQEVPVVHRLGVEVGAFALVRGALVAGDPAVATLALVQELEAAAALPVVNLDVTHCVGVIGEVRELEKVVWFGYGLFWVRERRAVVMSESADGTDGALLRFLLRCDER
ncbi:hypothetical protein PG985_007644 [Apiospora marii]|uniref:Uncharacterized protein n=1 Tax=Apiospora marii TaxID=335849 RepID=A0ABR1SN08_9PEZI